jgi:hypothetical protein
MTLALALLGACVSGGPGPSKHPTPDTSADTGAAAGLTLAGELALPGAMDVWGEGDVVVVAGGDNPSTSVLVADISDPANPRALSTITGVPGVRDVELHDGLPYVASDCNCFPDSPEAAAWGGIGLRIYDLADPTRPVLLSAVGGTAASIHTFRLRPRDHRRIAGEFDGNDCDPSDGAIYAGAPESCDTIDSDCDGDLVDGASDLDGDGTPDCVDPDVDGDGDLAGADCDDGDASIAHGAAEVLGDGVDQDCDGGDTCRLDADADGYGAEGATFASADLDCTDVGEGGAAMPATDCDDGDPSRNPGISEVADDGVDSDCDGGDLCYADVDADGYRATSGMVTSADLDCADRGEARSADPAVDCDDSSASVHPGATEVPGNGVDSDCDGGEVCYADADDDGYVDDGGATVISADKDCNDAGEGTDRDAGGDCDDGAASVHPFASEAVGDGIDADCDGGERCHTDVDGDGHGGTGTTASADLDCSDAGEAAVSGDCAPSDSGVSPGAREVCDASDEDEDCDGLADDDDGSLDATTASDWHRDVDGDGYGDASTVTVACDAPRFYVADGSDCDDGAASVHPGAAEAAGDEVDSNCDGAETCYVDSDGDRQRAATTLASVDTDCDDAPEAASSATVDCDDGDAAIYAGAPEVVGDAVDQDCDDLAEAAHPGGTEEPGNAIDEDCDGEAAPAPDDGKTEDGGGACDTANIGSGAGYALAALLLAAGRRKRPGRGDGARSG